ncbi:MAG: bifunctional riboflavin kinase/FAD synthetase [Lachnospiraceae bacterium]|nr:bifunctional riboflavin kinase/FAD synthetase [Lachnospiraceae bacterium]
MQIISGIDGDIHTAVAIGKFDGMHLGHRKLLEEISSHREKRLHSLVFTFESPVMDFFTGEKSRVLTTNDEKLRLFEEAGVEFVYIMPVNKDTVSYEPEAFVKDMLVTRLHASLIAAGADLSFGDKGAGNMALIKRLSSEHGGEPCYRAVEIDKVMYGDQEISSTLVRDAVASGDMERAGAMLGRPYSIYGRVEHGRMLGRTIDMPTANLIPDEDKLMPPYGVYRSEVFVGGRKLKGITNIGVKPTVKDDDAVTVETHIPGFEEDIYGQDIEVRLLSFIRPEMKFDSIDMLKTQIKADILKIADPVSESEAVSFAASDSKERI